MTNILKPFGRGKVLTEEEVVAQLEGHVVPVVEIPVEQHVVVQPPTDIIVPENLGDIVDFHGYELVKSEYDALTSIAKDYFQNTAEEYFNNVIHPNITIYLSIRNQHVTWLSMGNQNLLKVPVEVGELTELQILFLDYNQITQIENLDKLSQLKELHILNNPIDYNLRNNQTEVKKLEYRGVTVYR